MFDPLMVDADERVAKHERMHGAKCRRATSAEVKALLAELDARYFGTHREPYRVSWVRDRLKGAAGD